jgi:hypothetical protein
MEFRVERGVGQVFLAGIEAQERTVKVWQVFVTAPLYLQFTLFPTDST